MKGVIISTPKDIFRIKNAAPSQKLITIALRNLLNFAEEMDLLEDVQIIKMRRGLKVVKNSSDNYIPSTSKVMKVYRTIEDPRHKLIFEILLFSGIRIREAVHFVNEFDKEKLEIKENFTRYPLFYLRKSKRVYYVYLPLELALKIEKTETTPKAVERYFQKRGLPAKYLRKWNYNFLIMHNVPESVADFIQGRASISIGSMHYLAKVKQADYWYSKVADILISTFEGNKENIPMEKSAIAEAKTI